MLNEVASRPGYVRRGGHGAVLVGALLVATLAGAADHDTTDPIRDQPPFSVSAEGLLAYSAAAGPEVEEGAVLLFRENEFRLDEQGRVEKRIRVVYRIDSEAAVEAMAFVNVMWRPWHQDRPEVRARVVTKDGSEHQLNPEDIGEYSADPGGPELFGDTKALRGPLPAVAPGAVAEEQYIVRDTKPFFAQGTMDLVGLGLSLPVLHTRIILDAPAATRPSYVTHLLPGLEIVESEQDGRVRLIFEHGALEAHESTEMFLPSDIPPLPFIGFTTVPDWGVVASGYAQIVEEQLKGANVTKLVNKTLRNVTDREEKIARLLEAVQERVRYTGVEFGARAIVPSPPKTTLERGFGDCKDKSTLLVAMLREAGIDSRVALLSVGPGYDLDPELPGLQIFDHAIVEVPGDPSLWIDPTHRYARAGELPVADQGRQALVIDPGTTELTLTPTADAADNGSIETREVFLQSNGGGRIVETTEWYGAFERSYREFYSSITDTELTETHQGYIEEEYGAGELTDSECSDVAVLSRPLTLRLEAEDLEYAWTTPTEAWVLIPIGPLLGELPLPFFYVPDPEDPNEKPRTQDLVLSIPHFREWRYVIHAPPGYVLRKLPEPRTHEFGPTRLREEFAVDEEGIVTGTLRFDTVQDRFAPEELTAAATRIEALFELDATQVVFDQLGELHLAGGRVQEALDEFQRLAAEYPEAAVHRAQIARALIAAGLGEAAREEARRATELEPESALAYKTLGLALTNDQLGRKHSRGFDLAGAETAFRKAKQLDPEDFEARGELAILLEHDEQGVRYGSGARLDEAIAEYQAIVDDLGEYGLVGNMLIAMLRNGQFAEAKTLAYEQRETPIGVTAYLVATAIVEGTDDAIREATRLLDQPSSGEYLVTAAEELVQMRRYAEAAELMTVGSKGTPNALAQMARAGQLRQTRRHDEKNFSSETPEGLMARFFLNAFRDEAGQEAVMDLFATPVREKLTPEELREFTVAMDFVRRTVRRAGLSPDIVLDVLLSLAKFSVEGDHALGYRVRIEMLNPQAGQSFQQIAYVVREGERCLLVGFRDVPAPVGELILSRIDEEDLEGARHWLDWIHEDTNPMRGDDPLSLHPFRRLWSPESELDAARMRYAAATLMTDKGFSEEAIRILEDGIENSESEELEMDLNLALVRIATLNEKHETGVVAARRLVEAYPESDLAFSALIGNLMSLKRRDEAREAAERRLEKDADDDFALQVMAELSFHDGDAEPWVSFMRGRIDSGDAEAVDYNNLAWYQLGEEEISEDTLGLAQRSVVMTNYTNVAFLHTLAAVYAALDRPVEAREVLLQIIDNRETGKLNEPEDWLIFGRIAESYGVVGAAREAYLKVTPEEDRTSAQLSCHELAQRRLSGLDGEKTDDITETP